VPLSGNVDTTPFSASGGLAKSGAQRFSTPASSRLVDLGAERAGVGADDHGTGAAGFSPLTAGGLYGWKVTYVNAAGEGLPSAAGTLTMTTSADMTAVAPRVRGGRRRRPGAGRVFNWAVTFVTAIGETARGTASGNVTVAAYARDNVVAERERLRRREGREPLRLQGTVVTADGESTLGDRDHDHAGHGRGAGRAVAQYRRQRRQPDERPHLSPTGRPTTTTITANRTFERERGITATIAEPDDPPQHRGEADERERRQGLPRVRGEQFPARRRRPQRRDHDRRRHGRRLGGDILDTIGCGKRITVGVPTSTEPGVVARRIYRTVAGGSEYFLVGEIQDNVTTSFVDMKPDASWSARAGASTLGRQISHDGPDGADRHDRAPHLSDEDEHRRRDVLPRRRAERQHDDDVHRQRARRVAVDHRAVDEHGRIVGERRRRGAAARSVVDRADRHARAAHLSHGGRRIRVSIVGQVSDNTTTTSTTADDGALTDGAPLTNAVGAFLTGCSGIVNALQQGDPVAISVQRDDATAQTALAALEGGDGIHEHQIDDTSLDTIAKITARGDAELALFKNPIVTVTYATHDTKSRAGKSVSITLGAPQSLSGTFTIQEVEIRDIDVAPGVFPVYVCTASSVRFSLEDLLRRLEVAA
jgi:hypothetical protein